MIQFVQTDVAKVDNARSYYWYNGYHDDQYPEDDEPAGWMYAFRTDEHAKGAYVTETVERETKRTSA